MLITPLQREWFDTNLFFSREWWWLGADKQHPQAGGPVLAAKGHPSPMLPTVPSAAVWARDISVRFAYNAESHLELQTAIKFDSTVRCCGFHGKVVYLGCFFVHINFVSFFLFGPTISQVVITSL